MNTYRATNRETHEVVEYESALPQPEHIGAGCTDQQQTLNRQRHACRPDETCVTFKEHPHGNRNKDPGFFRAAYQGCA